MGQVFLFRNLVKSGNFLALFGVESPAIFGRRVLAATRRHAGPLESFHRSAQSSCVRSPHALSSVGVLLIVASLFLPIREFRFTASMLPVPQGMGSPFASHSLIEIDLILAAVLVALAILAAYCIYTKQIAVLASVGGLVFTLALIRFVLLRAEQAQSAPNLFASLEFRFRYESWVALLAGGSLLLTAGFASSTHWLELLPQSSKLAKPVLGVYFAIALVPLFVPLYYFMIGRTESILILSCVTAAVAVLLAIACRFISGLVVVLLLVMAFATFTLSVLFAAESYASGQATLEPLTIVALGLAHVSVVTVVLLLWRSASPRLVRPSTSTLFLLAAFLLVSFCREVSDKLGEGFAIRGIALQRPASSNCASSCSSSCSGPYGFFPGRRRQPREKGVRSFCFGSWWKQGISWLCLEWSRRRSSVDECWPRRVATPDRSTRFTVLPNLPACEFLTP